ncbi:MAG: capsular biosynthesis protein [Crocinitomicaceae bacterium]|nr:histidinol phosphatase [Flavobacteriales bacterium]NQZ37492.1 capsular biosynthesis protein [Crocinitomicaceae bacterium]
MGIFNRFFGRRRTEMLPPVNLSLLKVDMHSHLIPGIDDGSRNMDETIAMLAKFESLGYQKIITTPHIMGDFYKNTPEIILGGLEEVRSTAKSLGLKIEIEAAAEYYFDECLMDRLKRKERLLTFGDNHLLFEFSMMSKPDKIEELFFEMLTQNYKPILAHFERYTFFFGCVDKALEWREKGIEIQLNLNSLTGHYGPDVKKQAQRLVDSGAIDYVASDCHRMDHLMIMEGNLQTPYFHKVMKLDLKNSLLF